MADDPRAPYRVQFDNARDPYAARNALGIVGTGGGGAPTDAQYIVAADDPDLTNDRVLTNTATVTWDFTTPGQAKANAGGGNVSNVGTPTSGQYARWTTATTIAGVAPATVLADIGAQPVGSYQPLDADLTAIAALTGTNTIYYRSAADTWSPVVVSTGLAFSGGNLTATGGSSTSDPTPPQGRLTLQTLTPVMTTTQSAKTTIFYTPYVGNKVPIYDGTSMAMTTFAELSVATTDTTKSPAAVGASKCNDWFVWSDSGTIRIGHGPDWTSDTARSAGTALVMVDGLLLNNAAITNGPAAQRGTYVGTTRSNASSQLDWIYGTTASPPVAAAFNVWNAYNREIVSTIVADSIASWTYNSTVVREAGARTTMVVSFISGLALDEYYAQYASTVNSSAAGVAIVGIGYDSTTAFSGVTGTGTTVSNWSTPIGFFQTTALGRHTFSANEAMNSGNVHTFYGTSAFGSMQTSGLYFRGMM